ncbi:MAG: hypothetical protein Q9227_002879 [Pyrenula ochraceoflavens]
MSRLTLEARLSLLDALQCRVMLHPAKRFGVADEILTRWEMQTFTMPELEELLDGPDVEVYPYKKDYEQARTEPYLCLHTSGSTGLPKPVLLKHGTMTHHDLFLQLPELGGRTLNQAQFSGSRVLLGFPLFHSAGMCFMTYAIYSNTTMVFSPSYPITAEAANILHATGTVGGSFLPPDVLVEIAKTPEYLENIRRLRYLTFGGAPLPRAVGDTIKDYTHLFVSFGATETGYYALESTEPEDWEYVQFSPFMGCELRDVDFGSFEFQFVRQERLRDFQGVFATFPDLKTYAPRDLYSKHPTKKDLWLYEGRSDDLICASHGQKFNPIAMEGLLQTHPRVRGALVCGESRPRNTLLIEPNLPSSDARNGAGDDEAAIVHDLWPLVEQANAKSPEYARIDRSMILFTRPEKPMVRADKGSILRKSTANAYKKELDDLYERLDVTKPSGLLVTE